MKGQILRTIKIIFLGAIISVGLGYLQAAWNPAPGSPPNNNTLQPINTGIVDQIKSGGLAIGSLAVYGDTQFYGDSLSVGLLTSLASTLKVDVISNRVGIGMDSPTEALDVAGSIKLSDLAGSEVSPLCSDDQGVIILCSGVDITIFNDTPSAGVQIYEKIGGMQTTSGDCTVCTSRFFVMPNGATQIDIKVWGAGGGGAGGGLHYGGPVDVYYNGGGGGGGGYARGTLLSSAGAVSGALYVVEVGLGGRGGASGPSTGDFGENGENGGDSRFGNLISAQGGDNGREGLDGPLSGGGIKEAYSGPGGSGGGGSINPAIVGGSVNNGNPGGSGENVTEGPIYTGGGGGGSGGPSSDGDGGDGGYRTWPANTFNGENGKDGKVVIIWQ